jgi:hypothetical protein
MRAVATLIHSRFGMQRMRGALGAVMADALSRHLISRTFLLQAAEKRFLVSLTFRASPVHCCCDCNCGSLFILVCCLLLYFLLLLLPVQVPALNLLTVLQHGLEQSGPADVQSILSSLATPVPATTVATPAGLPSSSSAAAAGSQISNNDHRAISAVARSEARWLLGVFNLSRLQCDSLDASENPHTPALRPQLPLRSAFARFTVPQALRILAQTLQSGISVGASVDCRPALHLCVTQTAEAQGDPLAAAAFQKAYAEEERAELDAAFVHCGFDSKRSTSAAPAAAPQSSTEPINEIDVSPSIIRTVSTGIGRLDANSLSAVLSFLSPEDFLRSLRVARSWSSLRGRVAAWPAPLQLCPCMTAKLAGVLVEELYADDTETLVRSCDAYRQLIGPGPHHAHRVEAVLQCAGGGGGDGAAVTEMPARVVALLGHAAASVRYAALRLATTLMQGAEDHRRIMLSAGVLPALRLALPSQDVSALLVAEPLQDATVADALLLSLSRLALLGPACIDQILQCHFAEVMVAALRSRIDVVAHSAAFAVCVMMRSGTFAQQRTILLAPGALDALCDVIPRAHTQRNFELVCVLLHALRGALNNATQQQQQHDQGQPANDEDLLAVLRAKTQEVVDLLSPEARGVHVRRVLIAISHGHLDMPVEVAFAAIQNINAQEQQEQQA